MDGFAGTNEFRARRERYLIGHQTGLHATLVSIALGVAGISAASLLSTGSSEQGFLALFLLLWFVSLLGVGVVYAGVTVSVFLLPDRLPMVIDTFLPFGVGLSEFTLFALLTPPLLKFPHAASAEIAWFCCFSVFAAAALVAIQRAMWLHARLLVDKSGEPVPPDQWTVEQAIADRQIQRMRQDSVGAFSCSALGAIAAVCIAAYRNDALTLGYVFAVLTGIDLVVGLWNHDKSTRALERELIADTRDELPRQPTPRRRHRARRQPQR